MSSTVVVRGAGGAIIEMDVPASGHALERWNEMLAKGDLVIVEDPVEWVDAGEGATQLRVTKKPAPVARAKAKPNPDSEE